MNVGRVATRGAAVTLFGQLLQVLVQLIALTVLARLLTPREYGIFAMVIAVAGLASVLSDFGLSMAAIQAKALSHAQRSNLFWLNTALGLASALLVVAASNPLSHFYDQPAVAPVTQVLAVTFLLTSMSAQFRAHMARDLRFKALALTDVLGQAFGLMVAIAVAFAGGGYWALVTQQVVATTTISLTLVVMAHWLPGRPHRHADMKSLLTFGANSSGVQILIYATSNIDNIALGRVADAATLGLYNRAYQLFRLPLQQIAAPLSRVALPLLSRAEDEDFKRYIARSQLVLIYVFGGSFLGLAALADPVVAILLGDQWGGAVPLFVVLAVGGVFQAMAYVYYWTYTAKGLTGLQLRMTLITRSLMAAAILIGLQWGPLGVAAGASFGQFITWALNTAVAMPRAGMQTLPLVRAAARAVVFETVVALAGWFTVYLLSGYNPWGQVLAGGAVMLLLGGLLAALIRPLRRDFAVLVDTVRRVRS